MSDNLRDNFSSDEEYENFKKSYNDYINNTGMFGGKDSNALQNYINIVIKIEELVYKNIVLEGKNYFKVPDELLNIKYASLYVFYFKSVSGFPETVSILMN